MGAHNHVVPDQKSSLFHYSNPKNMYIFPVKGNKNRHFSKDKIPVVLIHCSFPAPRFPKSFTMAMQV